MPSDTSRTSATMSEATKLKAAILANDIASADALLLADAGLRALLSRPLPEDPFGATVLTHPATCGHLDMVDVLLRHGADINARSQWWAGGFGVLDSCDAAVAPALMARGARIDVHSASRLGMLDALLMLLKGDPDLVHARGGDGQTPLHFAATVDIARELVQRGADVNAVDVDHESTAAQYMIRDRQDVARYLVTNGCRTDILMAAALGDLRLVQQHLVENPDLVKLRVSPRSFPMRNLRAGGSIYIWALGSNATPHSVAREFGHDDVYDFLMSQTPRELKLVRAAESGDETLVRDLLDSGATVAASLASDDRRSIAVAASAGNTDLVRLMLRAGWPTDVRGHDDGTPLHWAAWMGNAAMAGTLVAGGAALEDRGDKYHLTPLGWALHGSLHSAEKEIGNYGDTVRVLLDAGAACPDTSDAINASDAAIEALNACRTRQRPTALPS